MGIAIMVGGDVMECCKWGITMGWVMECCERGSGSWDACRGKVESTHLRNKE